jgi:hypothetical protein
VRSSAYGSRFRVQGLESGNEDPMRATSVMHASSLYADRILAMEATSVACNTLLVAPVVTNNPLTRPPSCSASRDRPWR